MSPLIITVDVLLLEVFTVDACPVLDFTVLFIRAAIEFEKFVGIMSSASTVLCLRRSFAWLSVVVVILNSLTLLFS